MHSTPTPPHPLRQGLRLLALAGAVALMHAALWHGLSDSLAAAPPADRSQMVVQVRTVMPAAAAEPTPVIQPVAARPEPPVRRSAPRAQVVPEAPEAPESIAELRLPELVLVAAALPAEAPTAEPVAVAGAAPVDDVPVYRTTLPPAMTLSYDMHRGALGGTGQLQWRPTASGYQARLEGRVAGISILTWASEGGFDKAGIAPVRYTDQRRGKSMQAANFQRQAGKVSFSGPSTEYPLLQGSQDRLSWMIQIAAIASADPQRVAKGSRVSMFVVGARGDADVWSFQAQGSEEVSTGDTRMQAIKLVREPRKPHDTRVEVWLAPSLHHLPVRARLTSEGSTLELQLQSAQPAT